MLRTAGPNRLALRDPDADCETGANLSPVTPQLRDIRQDYTHNFEGMTEDPVPLDALIATRERLVRQVQRELDADERRFLLSLVRAEPEWPLLGIAHLEHLPGVRWKLQNLLQLRKDNARKFAEQADALVAGLESVH